MTECTNKRTTRAASGWRTAVLALSILVATGACGGGSGLVPGEVGRGVRPVLNGTATVGFEDHGIVLLVNESAEPGFVNLCTGTLITRRVVMTAAHCIAVASTLKGRVFFGPEPDWRNEPYHKVIHVERHPGFSGNDPQFLANDIALLLLESDAPAEATPWPIVPSALVAQLAGTDARVVGYGLYDLQESSGQKHTGTVKISAVGERTLSLKANPATPCSGDSGGPTLATIGGTEYVLTVHSTGTGCTGTAEEDKVSTRADFFTQDFIEPFLNRIATGSRTLGDRCYFDGNCGQGTCTQSEARENVKYCSKACTGDSDCTAGMLCRGATGQKMCHYPRVHPEVLTGLCIENIGCQTNRCSRFASGGVKTCTIDCNPSEQNPCPSGYACLSDLTNGGSACLKSSTPPPGGGGGGCSATGSTSGTGLALLLALVGLLALRRRKGSLSP